MVLVNGQADLKFCRRVDCRHIHKHEPRSVRTHNSKQFVLAGIILKAPDDRNAPN